MRSSRQNALTVALLDRLTHHVSILEMNGESYRLAHIDRANGKHRPEINR